ncbi:reverse transcriptase domain-containing protein [Tanacetum coccineum]
MAISVIPVSSDSSEESVGTSTGRVILFSTIPTTIPDTIPTMTPPTIHVDTTLTPTEIPNVSPIVSLSPDYTPASPDYSPVSDTEPGPSKDPDTPDTPPSPTHEIPPIEFAPPTSQILPAPFGVPRRRVAIVSPRQSIPYGRPYRYHPNGLVHMMTARKRVGLLPTHRLVMRYSVDYSTSDHFTSDDSSRDSPSDSSSETSSDASSDALSDSSTGHSSSDHSSPALPSADLLPPPKRIRSYDSVTYLEVSSDESSELSVPRETSLRDDVDVGGARGIDSRVVVEAVAREEVKTGSRGTVVVRDDKVTHHVVSDDILEPAQEEGAIEVTYETLGDLRDQGQKIVATGQQSAILSERVNELERDNTRLRGMTMPNTRSGATMTREAVDNLIARRGGENGDDYEDGNGNGNGGVNGNGNGGGNDNRNSNGNEGGNGYKNHNENVITAEPIRLQDAIRITNNLMDPKLKGYDRSAENKIRLDNNPRYNRGKQPTFKQQNVGGQNIARAYTAGNNEKKGDCTAVVTPKSQSALVGNQPGVVCYECGRPRHYKKDCPKLRNQNRGNKTGNNEATARAYANGGGGANPVSNVVMDTSYVVELVDGRISETSVVFRGCTLGLLGHLFDIDLMPVELGSFDVIIGMDWLASGSKLKLSIITCMKTQKYIQKGCQVYLAQVTSNKIEENSEEKRLEDMSIVWEFLKVFLEDLPGLPPARQVKF